MFRFLLFINTHAVDQRYDNQNVCTTVEPIHTQNKTAINFKKATIPYNR